MASIYKTGLYINDMKVDIENTDVFLFKYSNNDVIDPQAIRNAYSKTISIKGTSNNNKIFNQLWKLDHTLHGINSLFNPMQRNPFEIYDNGNLIEAGYVQLNSIKYVKNDPVYDVTLFGMLGDFFYKLMYSSEDSDKEMTLADLQYDLYRIQPNSYLGLAETVDGQVVPSQDINDLTIKADDTNANAPILLWDKNYIWNSWLCSFTDKYNNSDHDLWEQFITSAPVYNGYHDDFDNDHVLVNMNYNAEYNPILPASRTSGGTNYGRRQNYSLITTQREMDEWEIRDLRSTFQRPAIKFAKLMKIISDYSLKQGYRIRWDRDIDITGLKPQNFTTLNDYFWKTYILLNTIQFSEQYADLTEIPQLQDTWDSTSNILPELYLENPTTHTTTFDLSTYENPSIKLTIMEEFRPYNFADPTVKTPAMLKIDGGWQYFGSTAFSRYNSEEVTRNSTIGMFVYLIEVIVNGSVNSDYTKLLYIYNFNGQELKGQTTIDALNKKCKELAEDDYGTSNYEIINIKSSLATYPAEDFNVIRFDEAVQTTINNLPDENNVRIRITKDYFNLYDGQECSELISGRCVYYKFAWVKSNIHPSNTSGNRFIVCELDSGYTMNRWRDDIEASMSASGAADFKDRFYIDAQLYSGTATSSKNQNVSKNDLLANTSSPFKYLTDWCKLFNLRFRTDILTKTIYIETPEHYYKNDIVDIDKKIDYGKDFLIDPVFVENNIYKFTLEDTDSDDYAKYIYKKTFNIDYSTKNFITNYAFNNEPLDVFEDNIYKTNIDYLMTSPYLNIYKGRTVGGANLQYPTMLLMPKYESTLWSLKADGSWEENTATLYGLQSYNRLSNSEDGFTKQCLFDKDYKSLESDNCLLLFDGIYKIPEQLTARYVPFMLTDDLDLMNDLNDGNACFLNSSYFDDEPYTEDTHWIYRSQTGRINTNNQDGTIGIWTFWLPILHTSLRSASSTTFDKTYYFNTPNTNDNKAFFGNTKWSDTASMFNKWWNTYESDVLDSDSKTVECQVFLRDMPREALRKFYFFKNTLWSLLEITDYNYKNKDHAPTKCKFIKVENIDNYRHTPTETPEPTPPTPGPETDEDLYQCQWIIGQWGGEPFTAQDLEDALDNYYADWRIYTPNVDLFDEIVANIAEGYITGVHTVEKPMFNALSTIGVDMDVYGYYSIETEGEVIIIPHE